MSFLRPMSLLSKQVFKKAYFTWAAWQSTLLLFLEVDFGLLLANLQAQSFEFFNLIALLIRHTSLCCGNPVAECLGANSQSLCNLDLCLPLIDELKSCSSDFWTVTLAF